jgi:peptide/nickel transport system substrate-binding protein
VTEAGDSDIAETGGTPTGGSQASSPAELRTFMIADIRGYTTYTREHGDEAAAALASRFGEIVAEVVAPHDGFLLELRGDEALVAFASARKALRAAVELQERFTGEGLPRGVGIGLDAGEAIPVGTGFRGTSLNLAARLSAQAAAGQTLASEAVIHLAAKVEGIAYVDARELKLKGFNESVRAVVVLPTAQAKGHRLASDRRSRGRTSTAFVLVAIITLVALIGTAVGALLLRGNDQANVAASPTRPGQSSGPSSGPTTPATPSSPPDLLGDDQTPVLAFYDASTGTLRGTTKLESPRNLSFYAGGWFWILTENPNAFHQVDPQAREVVKTINVPPVEPHGFSWDDDYIWVTDLGAPQVYRIDQRTGTYTIFPFGDEADMTPAGDVTIGDGSVWLSRDQHDPPQITRIDRLTGKIQAHIAAEVGGLTYGADALWYWRDGRIGRIDPETNEPSFDMVELEHDGYLGNIYFGGGDAWTDSTGSGRVFRIDSRGRFDSYDLEPGVADMAPSADAMWVTNFDTGELTGIDLITGQTDRKIRPGHSVMAVASSGDEVMLAVGPTADEVIARLPGSTLTMAADGIPWWDPAPDPPLAGNWPVQQTLHLTCANLLTYPDDAGKDGLKLIPEVADLPAVSEDGLTYTFTIRPGFKFSPPSNEAVTAETFRYSIQRALNPLFADDWLGPNTFRDIAGAAEYRAGTATTVSGLVATDNQLQITLTAPAPDLLDRLASTVACAVPINGTPALRSGLKPFPPVSGAGPYYLAQTVGKRLVVFKKNPNYSGNRPQLFDNIAIKAQIAAGTALGMVQRGAIDAAIFEPWNTLTGPGSALAQEWGPNGTQAAAGNQRWFGAARSWVNYMSLNPTGPALRDPAVRQAVALALDRADLASVFIEQPTNELLISGARGANPLAAPPEPDVNGAQALLEGQPVTVTMLGIPDEWNWDDGKATEQAIVRQLSRAGITVELKPGDPEDFYGHGVMDAGSDVDIVWNRATGSDFSDPVQSLGDLMGVGWLGKANLDELVRLGTLSGLERIDGAVAFAHRLVTEDYLIVPYSSPLNPFFVSERIGCAFVQPAYGAVDILSLCLKDGPATPSASPSP